MHKANPNRPGFTNFSNPEGKICIDIAREFNIKLLQLYGWNPFLNGTCTNLRGGETFCVNGTAPAWPNEAPGPTLPDPAPNGTPSNCKLFYRADIGDSGTTITNQYKITLDEFSKWNPDTYGVFAIS